jgi:hypothetical protein
MADFLNFVLSTRRHVHAGRPCKAGALVLTSSDYQEVAAYCANPDKIAHHWVSVEILETLLLVMGLSLNLSTHQFVCGLYPHVLLLRIKPSNCFGNFCWLPGLSSFGGGARRR